MNYRNKILPFIIIAFIAFIIVSNTRMLSYAQESYTQINNNIAGINSIEIEHLTFNTLMAFPEKALSDSNNLSSIYDESKITVNEFKNILEELYKNNFVLVDIYDIIDITNNTIKQSNLPKDKKPLILSFDNVSYKSNYQNLGEIDKLIIDRNNNLASYTTKKSIQDRVQYDNEFELILENFIKKHNDFSFNNARGIIFLTGENGVLGYNTNHKNASSKYEQKRVSEVIKKLKSLGWRFGSNNYSYKSISTKNDLEFAKELSLWNQEIKSLIGDTNIFAFPYGEYSENNVSKLELLLTNGFKIFFTNSFENTITQSKDIFFMNRKEVNGNTLRNNSQQFENLFDCKKVYDNEFRKVKFNSNKNQTINK